MSGSFNLSPLPPPRSWQANIRVESGCIKVSVPALMKGHIILEPGNVTWAKVGRSTKGPIARNVGLLTPPQYRPNVILRLNQPVTPVLRPVVAWIAGWIGHPPGLVEAQYVKRRTSYDRLGIWCRDLEWMDELGIPSI